MVQPPLLRWRVSEARQHLRTRRSWTGRHADGLVRRTSSGSTKRGRKAIERNPLQGKVQKLERECARLEKELHKAHLIIDVQGKVAGLLGLSLEDETNS